MKAWTIEVAQTVIVAVCVISVTLMSFWASPALHAFFFPVLTRFVKPGDAQQAELFILLIVGFLVGVVVARVLCRLFRIPLPPLDRWLFGNDPD